MRKLAPFLLFAALPLLAQTSFLEQGKAAMRNNDAEKAAELFEKAVAQQPNSAEAHYLLGSAYGSQAQKASMFAQMGLAKKTKDEFEAAVKLDPNHLEARFGLVQYYTMAPGIMGGSYDQAFVQTDEIRKRDPLMAHRARAYILQHQKKLPEARAEYAAEVKEYPNSARAHYDMGGVYTNEKNWAAAQAEYDTALKLDPNFISTYFRIGQLAALSSSNFARGEEMLRKYLTYTPAEKDPPHARTHYWLGQIFEKQGKKAEAKERYNLSLKLNPNQKDVQEALKRVS